MIYIYRRAASEGANELVEDICLLGTRARRTQGGRLANLVAGDHVICWGDAIPNRIPAGVKTLNNAVIFSKFDEAQKLAAAGVPTIQVSRHRPVVQRRAAFAENRFPVPNGNLTVGQANALADEIREFVRAENARRQVWERQPAANVEWLARRNNHQGGTDLLNPPAAPDFFSKKEDLVDEYRVHMFLGKSIRAGHKIQREARPNGRPAHAWIRSFDAGWIIQYANFASTRVMREIAANAVKALGLDFGAVDIGKRRDGTLIVLEVNRAPGVENGTSEAYARKIVAWSRGE